MTRKTEECLPFFRQDLALLIFSGLSTRRVEWKEGIEKRWKMMRRDTLSINLVTRSRAGMYDVRKLVPSLQGSFAWQVNFST